MIKTSPWTASFFLALLLFTTSASALTSGQAYHAATQFLRSQGAAAFEESEAQAILLGEAIGGDALAAGPRSTTLLASLALVSVDARARRTRTLSALGLAVGADVNAVIAARTPSFGFGVSAGFLPTALDTALALQALDAAGQGGTSHATQSAADLCGGAPVAPTGGLWPLLRNPSGAAAVGDVATTAQVVLALAPRQAACPTAFANAINALVPTPPRASERALRLLAFLAWSPTHANTATALTDLLAAQNTNGSFGNEPLAFDRVYATALAARALKRAGEFSAYTFDSDGDTIADGPDNDSDNDGYCDPNESGAGCTDSDAFPTDPGERADLDRDGIGDEVDPDLDGDGIGNGEDDYPTLAQEHFDADEDSIPDTTDMDDDNDGLPDVEELLAGLDPKDVDTDGDTFTDYAEDQSGHDPRSPLEYPLPDGDVFPLGAPDGIVDARDELLIHRVLRGLVTVPSGDLAVFMKHADVAPLVSGSPVPSGAFDAADAMIVSRRVRGMVPAW